ncbi:MAG: hypothetical protein RL685_1378 [Pseudomonadota bacterium]|jgi:hypothetical protein
MTQSNNDIEELEELLTELEGQEAQLVRPYGEDDDAVTRLMDAPLGDQEWMVQVTALDRRMMSQDNLLADLRAGKLSSRTLVWRGGMEDWLPIARVDGLSRGAAGPGSFPPGSLPAPPVRPAATAPLQAPPMWSQTMPSAAPLPPPPSALAPAMSSSPRSAMPMNGMGLPPAAAAPLPPPPSSPSLPPPDMMSSGSNTSRPVAIDFSDMVEDTRGPLRGKRAVMALSAVAILAVFISVYAMSSKTDGTTANVEPSRAEQPRAVAALQPATEKKSEPLAAAATRPAEPAPEVAKPSESEADSEASSGSSSARANAPARYSPRSEYRRRSRGGSGSERASEEPEAAEAPAAAAASRATAPAAVEEEPAVSDPAPVVAADDDADAAEAPKSTGKAANTFNREAAKSALDDAAGQAKNCRPAGGPSGTGRVQVRYEPSGRVSNVSILTGKFENTTTGSCVKMLFRRAKVPEFTGVPVVVVNKSFEIP